MKTKILFILLTIVAASHTHARERGIGVEISTERIERKGNNLEFRFTLSTSKKALKSRHTLYLSPVLAHGTRRASSPLIVVQRRKAAIAQRRHEREILDIIERTDKNHADAEALTQLKTIDNGETYRRLYTTYFPGPRNATYIKIYYTNK
jgi:hypothetical protein